MWLVVVESSVKERWQRRVLLLLLLLFSIVLMQVRLALGFDGQLEGGILFHQLHDRLNVLLARPGNEKIGHTAELVFVKVLLNLDLVLFQVGQRENVLFFEQRVFLVGGEGLVVEHELGLVGA